MVAEHGADHVDGDHPDRGVLLLEVAGHSRDRSAGADPGHEDVDPTLHLLPDLGPGGEVVGFVVLAIVVLIGEEGAGGLGRHLARLAVVALGMIGIEASVDEDQFDAHGPQAVALLLAGLSADDHLAVQPVLRRHHGEAHGGVAGGGLDHGAARLQPAVGQRPFDQEAGDAVLHAAHRIEELELGPGLCRSAGETVAESNDGRVTDGVTDAIVASHPAIVGDL